MTHEQAAAELSALLDGALAAPQRDAVRSHLDSCADCRAHLEELRGAVALFREHGRREAPAYLKTRVLARAREPELPAADPLRLWKPALAWSFVAAAVLVVSTGLLQREMPALFQPTQGMISGAAGGLEGGEPMAPAAAPAPAAPAQDQAERKREATLTEGKGVELRAAAVRGAAQARRPAQSVEIGGFAGAGAAGLGSAKGAEALEAESASEAAVRGPVPLLRLFREESAFRGFWSSVTSLPAPAVDFGASMVVVLADAPPGRAWAVLSVEETDREFRILYKDTAAPRPPPGAPGPALPPAFRILPRSDKVVHPIRSR